jgi:hypothetical protein
VQAQGNRFALDDFGAGMPSFAYLRHLTVDYVKIDGSFIKDILQSLTERAMVESINQIAHVMGKQTGINFIIFYTSRRRISFWEECHLLTLMHCLQMKLRKAMPLLKFLFKSRNLILSVLNYSVSFFD